MGKRYRRNKNSIVSIVGDVVHTASKLPWWGALMVGVISYLLISFALAGYIESNLATQEGSKFYPIIQARLGRIIHVCEWVGLACLFAGSFFAVRNYFISSHVTSNENRLVTFLSKMLGRSLD